MAHLATDGAYNASPHPGATNRGPTTMNFNKQHRMCHAERSEASVGPSRETLRFTQGDTTFPILLVKAHNREPMLDKSAFYCACVHMGQGERHAIPR